jgi:hypothetical protein
MEWKTIDSAPWNKWVLCWWTPVDGNPWAETVIVAQVMAPDDPCADDAKPTKYWDGHAEGPIHLLTHWMPLPSPPGSTSTQGDR